MILTWMAYTCCPHRQPLRDLVLCLHEAMICCTLKWLSLTILLIYKFQSLDDKISALNTLTYQFFATAQNLDWRAREHASCHY